MRRHRRGWVALQPPEPPGTSPSPPRGDVPGPACPSPAPSTDTAQAEAFERWWDLRERQRAREGPDWPLTAAALAHPTPCGLWDCVCCRAWLEREEGNRRVVERLEHELTRLRGPTAAPPAKVTDPFGHDTEDTHAAAATLERTATQPDPFRLRLPGDAATPPSR